MTSNEVKDLCPLRLKIQVQDTWGTSLTIKFDHIDVSGEDWIETFKTIMIFLGFAQETIKELFNEDYRNSSDPPFEG